MWVFRALGCWWKCLLWSGAVFVGAALLIKGQFLTSILGAYSTLRFLVWPAHIFEMTYGIVLLLIGSGLLGWAIHMRWNPYCSNCGRLAKDCGMCIW